MYSFLYFILICFFSLILPFNPGHMCYKRTKLEAPFHKVIQPGNLPLEKAGMPIFFSV